MPKPLDIAVVQTAPIPLAVADGIKKAVRDAERAIRDGAQVIAFGETVLGGYPMWLDEAPGAALWGHPGTVALHRILLAEAVHEADARLAPLQNLADKHDVIICIGAHFRLRSSLYNAQLTFRKKQPPLVRRKLVPTHGERLIWMRGDGSTLEVHQAGWGRLSTLMCWEHWMPMTRAALHAQGPDVHVSAWPTVRDAYLVASRHYAFEGSCFVLAAGTVQHRDDILDGLARVGGDDEAEALIRDMPDAQLQRGGSAIIAPDATIIRGPADPVETILMADIDLDRRAEALTALDSDGHYSRPDIFDLRVNTRPMPGVTFSAEEMDLAHETRGEFDV
ncbi:MAG: carbon-nitrogen hydrolase family protein [Pacificimonas sp.]